MFKIKLFVKVDEDYLLPQIIDKGEWIDLCAAEDVEYNAPRLVYDEENKFNTVAFDEGMISLGVAMQIPEGFEADVLPRSSTDNKYGVMLRNSQGVIDSSYCGNNDIWRFLYRAMRKGAIHKGDRIAQFRIQLSQKASFWTKLKWLFSDGVEIVSVDTLYGKDRGGIGSTGTTTFKK